MAVERDDDNEKDLIVWCPDEGAGNAIIGLLAGELEDAPDPGEPAVVPVPTKPIKIPNQ